MDEILHLKHYPKRQTSKSEIHVCRFGGEPNLALLKSLVSMLWDPHTKNASVARLQTRKNLREKRNLICARISYPSTVQIESSIFKKLGKHWLIGARISHLNIVQIDSFHE